MLLWKQHKVSPKRGIPADLTNVAKVVTSVSNETIQLYYLNSGVLTSDAGQAAGVIVFAKLANSGILDAIGYKLGDRTNSSLAITTNTTLVQEVSLPEGSSEAFDDKELSEIHTMLNDTLSNGQYFVDYRNGVIYGKKAATGTTVTGAYKIAGLVIKSLS